jgi:hypothetical protein
VHDPLATTRAFLHAAPNGLSGARDFLTSMTPRLIAVSGGCPAVQRFLSTVLRSLPPMLHNLSAV